MKLRELRLIRAIVGLVVLVVLALTVNGYFREYRDSDGGGEAQDQPVSTPTTPSAEQGGEQSAEGQSQPATPAVGNRRVVVLIDGLNLRKEAKADSPTLGGLGKGDKLTLIGQTEGWYEVQTADGSRGWVSANPSYVRIEE